MKECGARPRRTGHGSTRPGRPHARPAARAAVPPPAARPAARRGASRINWDRVGRIALTLVLAAVLYSYLNPAIDFVKTYTATTDGESRAARAAATKTSASTSASSPPTTRSWSTARRARRAWSAEGETPDRDPRPRRLAAPPARRHGRRSAPTSSARRPGGPGRARSASPPIACAQRLLPDWEGAPARLVEAIAAIALLIWLCELLGTFGLFYAWTLGRCQRFSAGRGSCWRPGRRVRRAEGTHRRVR